MSGPLKRFIDSIRDRFSNPDDEGPLGRMSNIEPEEAEDSVESVESLYAQVESIEMEQEVET